MPTSTKPEVLNISQRRQRRTMRKNLVKFGRVVFELCKPTERQTNRHLATASDLFRDADDTFFFIKYCTTKHIYFTCTYLPDRSQIIEITTKFSYQKLAIWSNDISWSEFCINILLLTIICTAYSLLCLCYYRPRSRGDNTFSSVRPSVCLWALSCLNRLTFDLEFWH